MSTLNPIQPSSIPPASSLNEQQQWRNRKTKRPVLVWMYVRLARAEEREAAAQFGEAYKRYAKRVPGFIPHLKRQTKHPGEV